MRNAAIVMRDQEGQGPELIGFVVVAGGEGAVQEIPPAANASTYAATREDQMVTDVTEQRMLHWAPGPAPSLYGAGASRRVRPDAN